ncbi:MAG: SpoIIE family protein phosphatase [Anaerolineae bacterium]|nr:SpoIIE family protein phosphatase [Anaerolineae bacterium]
MLAIQTGRAQDTNNPNYRDSAAEYARFSPSSGLKLTVGMVSDAVRGGSLGPEAAIAGAMQTLSESIETDIPALLYSAFETAHKVLRRVGQENDIQLAATLTVALVVNNKHLYVANLGHSRVYLYRASTHSFEQLTLEHNFASIAVLEGRMSPRDALKHPDADMLSRYIGTPKLINPDMTIYADGEVRNLEEGMARGAVGLELQPNDAILIASNGLTQAGRQGGAVVTIDDILDALSREGARQAALAIVETAFRHHPSKPISVITMQAIPEVSAASRLTRGAIVGIVSTVALFILFGMIARFTFFGPPPIPVAPTRNPITQTALAAEIIRAFTATPTPTATFTPTATLPPNANRLGLNFLNEPNATDTGLDVERNLIVSAGIEHRVLTMDDFLSKVDRDPFVFAQPATDLRFSQVRAEEAYMILDRNGDVFVAVRDFNLFEVGLSQMQGINIRGDENSCFAVYYSSTGVNHEVTVSCYAGLCTYRLPTDEIYDENTPTPLPPIIQIGWQIKISLDTISVPNPPQPIPEEEARRYANIYQRRDNLSIGECISQYLPTATPTGSPTAIILPTDTPTGTFTPSPTPSPNIAALPATAAPAVPSATPRPTTIRYP